MNQYQEHLLDSQPDNSRWDGFDRGESDSVTDSGHKIICLLKSTSGDTVKIIEYWHGIDDPWFEVTVSGNGVHDTRDYDNAIEVAVYWAKR